MTTDIKAAPFKSYGDLIHAWRNEIKFPLSMVSQDTGISVDRLKELEKGYVKPEWPELEKLAKEFKVNVREMLPNEPDLDRGCKFLRDSEARPVDQKRDGRLQYTYWGRCMSSMLPNFKPVELLLHLTKRDDVVMNRGHFFHQFTQVLHGGPVAYLWEWEGQVHEQLFNQGDSWLIPGFVPHAFYSPDPENLGRILAITFGQHLTGDAKQELALIGKKNVSRIIEDDEEYYPKGEKNISGKSALLRSLLKEKQILKVMGAHNALRAKLIERHGFDAVWSSGFEIATAHGVPDANILTMTENLDAAINIHSATKLPVICDCDTGYGNANNVMHMVRKYEAAGMAALVIEDKRFPKVNSFIPGRQELASIEEFCGRLQAARAVQSSENGVMIFARLEALIAGWGVEEAYRRAVAYYEAGAEGFVIHSKSKAPDEIFAFTKIWNKKYKNVCPLVAIPTTYNKVTAKELAAEGFNIVIYANQGMRASVKAMHEVFEKIQTDGTTAGIEDRISPMDELFKLQGMPTYQEDEKKYSGEVEKVQAVIPAAADHKFQPELSSLLQDQPLCMIKLAGKTILDHQMDTLRDAGVAGFSVVVGYQKDQVLAKGITTIENPKFETMGSAQSVMCGLSKQIGKTLVSYSDILFDKQIPESLMDSPYSITLVIDRAFRSLPRRDKALDLVMTLEEVPQPGETRKMQPERFKKITRIGKKMDAETAHFEFIGMVQFSKTGLEQTKKAWAEAEEIFRNKPFYEAPNIASASMTDLFQYLIDRGTEIRGLVIEHGWSEIYSLEDYQRLEKYFAEKGAEFVTSRS